MEIIVLKEKHCTMYFKAETNEDKISSALKIFDNNKSYYTYPEEDKKLAEKIDKSRDGKAAWKFIWNRSYEEHEYEELELETVQ